MTVLLISYAGVLGGAERALLTFAAGLEGERWLACPEGKLAEAARREGLRVAPLRERPVRWHGDLAGRLRAITHVVAHRREVLALVGSLDPDLIVANGTRSALALALVRGPVTGRCLGRFGGRHPARAVRRRTPIVFVHHDMLPRGAAGWAVRRAADTADLVVVPSRAVAADLRARREPRVVHPGIAIEWFGESLGDPVAPPEVLLLGALVDWKRPDLALEAVAIARGRRPELDIRLRIVGAPIGEAGRELLAALHVRAAQADLTGAVEFCGAVADPRAELARATCLLHCAPREPFGLVMVEALAAGRPVVAPDGGGAREIVDPSCGVLYPPGDARAAADALLSVLERPDRGAALGAAGRRVAAERFDRRAAARSWAEAVEPPARERVPSRRLASGRLAIVTVTHESSSDLAALLASVVRHLPGARVVVVDCASSDDSAAVAARPWPGIEVELIALGENVGFGAGSNIGVRAVGEPVTALLNPDVELLDDSLLGLVDEALGGRSRRLLAPLVIRDDGRRQDSVHPFPLSSADLVHAVLPPGALCGRAAVTVAPWRSPTPLQVGWAVGCAVLARTQLLRELGPFDASIFLYAEDLDLGLRAREVGVETWFWPTARVLHHGGHSTLPTYGGEPLESLAAARRTVIARRLGRLAALGDDAVQGVTFASRMTIKRMLGVDAERERAQLRALTTGARERSSGSLRSRVCFPRGRDR